MYSTGKSIRRTLLKEIFKDLFKEYNEKSIFSHAVLKNL